jgi:DNA (cytosine-5)-methyltransferase 1|tara:strand:- start:1549 stop:2592 length:1044 start_codon:yes stop_codon:yes gene_type:complete
MYTVGGLFAGVGGIELGFEGNGFKVLWANEFDKDACNTYRSNFNHRLIEQDIHTLEVKDLSPVDVITAGFPCQAFSVAGYRKGFRDPRGNLFFEIMRLVDELPEKPKVLFLENVKNFYTHDKKNTYKVVHRTLEDYGYSVFTKILNSAEYTKIPHNRERTFIICFRGEVDWTLDHKCECSWTFDSLFPPPKSDQRLHIRDILEEKKVDDRFYYGESAYMYNELKKHMKSRDTVYQWRRQYVRENKSDMCPTLTANMGTGGHNVPLIIDDWGFRKLTPRECFRFQGYSDSFKLPKDVSTSQLYKQAGNSVTVPLIERLASRVKIALDSKYENSKNQKEEINVTTASES